MPTIYISFTFLHSSLCQVGVDVKDQYLLLTEFEVRTVSYGPSFFPFDLWPNEDPWLTVAVRTKNMSY